ncbi:MAG TPA: hypothetical protein PLP21_02580 [Pyrinomonadaceae bacterium]|nr:hypothetical protein [Acidobacteriota bacterium]HQZ95172.1 hypothetical protein [Pyrinomonadaceae bacterium]
MKNGLNIGLIALLLVVLGCSCPSKLKEFANKENSSTPRPTPATSSTPPSTTSTKGDYNLSMEKYNRIKVGMPRSEVENTLGGKGTEISSSVGGGVRFSVNKWEGEKFQSIILSFRNDKVMSKSQVGLK